MWKLRYWQPEQQRPTVIEVYDDRGIGNDLQHVIDNLGCTRVEAVRKGHPVEPKKKPPVKAQSIEWALDPSWTRGERWVGRVGGNVIAHVTSHPESMEDPFTVRMLVGELAPEWPDCSSIESGKRVAQRALNKVVQTLVGGS
jgi:hypothetical protein